MTWEFCRGGAVTIMTWVWDFLPVQTWQVLWRIPIYWVLPKHWFAVESVNVNKGPLININRFFTHSEPGLPATPYATYPKSPSIMLYTFPLPPCWALYFRLIFFWLFMRLGIGHFEKRSLKDFCTARPRYFEEWEVLKQRCHTHVFCLSNQKYRGQLQQVNLADLWKPRSGPPTSFNPSGLFFYQNSCHLPALEVNCDIGSQHNSR